MSKARPKTRGIVSAAVSAAMLGTMLAGCAATAPESENSELEFWGWNPAYEKVVDLWNSSHDQQVKFETTASGGDGGYTKMQAAVKAGNAPCLAQVGNESVPTLTVDGSLVDISEEIDQYRDGFPDSAWAAMGVGEGIYGVPVDIAPLALFYRTDVYEKFGVTPATTWEQFAADSAKVHAADPNVYLSSFAPAITYQIAGFVQQAGGTWYSSENDQWKVSMNGAETKDVAAYWQKMMDEDLTKVTDPETPEWFAAVQDGTIASYVAPVWWVTVLEGAAAGSSGKWRVAPMPNVDDDTVSTGTAGGSATSVLTGCDDVQGAVDFANWMSTDDGALEILIEDAASFPAATNGTGLGSLSEPLEFYGGQKVYEVFADAAPTINPNWQFGPANAETGSAYADAMKPVLDGTRTMAEGLDIAQASLVDALTTKGLSVTE
ncbi:ABC transporter substrate-binding protein [Agromyces cerinus]|uniref:Carbohydrate ABC transporter substrate-binding protein, CUT1 family n=1 Tax=Agromyces cerinus subsp. cerinus TaxID=232089 RepID=A0A1N6GJI6_9MICO|nr:extracellular solute-binding protein [Agromyces cerinus]SIO07641.1 carbohydrate ABC transporter substrate-binding protein, CUT1 family [Agromyces cerinus subsp. cerinus]